MPEIMLFLMCLASGIMAYNNSFSPKLLALEFLSRCRNSSERVCDPWHHFNETQVDVYNNKILDEVEQGASCCALVDADTGHCLESAKVHAHVFAFWEIGDGYDSESKIRMVNETAKYLLKYGRPCTRLILHSVSDNRPVMFQSGDVRGTTDDQDGMLKTKNIPTDNVTEDSFWTWIKEPLNLFIGEVLRMCFYSFVAWCWNNLATVKSYFVNRVGGYLRNRGAFAIFPEHVEDF